MYLYSRLPETSECTMFIRPNVSDNNNSCLSCICLDKVTVVVFSHLDFCSSEGHLRTRDWYVSKKKTRSVFSVQKHSYNHLTFVRRWRHLKSLHKNWRLIYGIYACDNRSVTYMSLHNFLLFNNHPPLSTF